MDRAGRIGRRLRVVRGGGRLPRPGRRRGAYGNDRKEREDEYETASHLLPPNSDTGRPEREYEPPREISRPVLSKDVRVERGQTLSRGSDPWGCSPRQVRDRPPVWERRTVPTRVALRHRNLQGGRVVPAHRIVRRARRDRRRVGQGPLLLR